MTNLKKEVLDINTKLEVSNVKDEAIKTEEFVIEDILGAIEDDDNCTKINIKDTIEEDDDCIKINIKKKKKKKNYEVITYFCNLCDFQTETKKVFNNHKFYDHEQNSCNDCGMKFSEYRDMKKHIDSFHANLNCSFCGKFFKNKHKLQSHEWNHQNVDKSVQKTKTSGFCNICGKKSANVDTHIKKVHEKPHLKDDSLKCKTCGLHCASKYDLQRHIKARHSTMGPEPCPYCGKFVKMLEKHLRRNQCNLSENERKTEDRIKCEDCGKDFKKQAGLKAHIKKFHSVGKNIKCDFCDYRTYENANLYIHVKRMHEGRSLKVECVHCKKMCVNIEWHMKMYHNGLLDQ